MAAKGKKSSTGVDIPECPVCLELMTAPIFLCGSGHSLCSSCTQALLPPNCPICRQPMTQMRNRSLEELIGKAKTACPNREAGCVYTLPGEAMAAHLEECIFRPRECPHQVFGKCSWTGELKKMVEHYKEKHSANYISSSEAEIEVANLDLKECGRYVYLASQQQFLFIITVKIDTIQRMAYWSIQHIGQKKIARQYIYEIHVMSKRDPQRKIVFTEHCFNDTMKVDEIFRQNNCAVVPLDMLAHFIKDKKLSFRFVITKLSGAAANKENNSEVQNEHQSRAPSSRSASRGRDTSQGPMPHGQGPHGPGPKGPGPKPHWKKPGQKAGPKRFTPAHS